MRTPHTPAAEHRPRLLRQVLAVAATLAITLLLLAGPAGASMTTWTTTPVTPATTTPVTVLAQQVPFPDAPPAEVPGGRLDGEGRLGDDGALEALALVGLGAVLGGGLVALGVMLGRTRS